MGGTCRALGGAGEAVVVGVCGAEGELGVGEEEQEEEGERG